MKGMRVSREEAEQYAFFGCGEYVLNRMSMGTPNDIINLAKELCEKHDGIVPGDYDALVALPGVGRKTANVVLAEGFGHQKIAVDTHVFRVSNRIGLAEEKDVLKTEYALMDILPDDRWTQAHHLLIFHGRKCCTARNPKCSQCGLKEICVYNNTGNH